MQPDDIVCQCFQVSRRKLESFARIERPRRPGQMSECFGAGTGCGWCRPILQAIFCRATNIGELDATSESESDQGCEPGKMTCGPANLPADQADVLLGMSPADAIRKRREWLRGREPDDPGD